MQITASNYAQIEELRLGYLRGLPLFQELFLEIMIEDASYLLIKLGSTNLGYAIVNQEQILLEFYIDNEFKEQSLICFEALIDQQNIKEIYCKSFDNALVSLCETKGLQVSTLGLLFRDYKESDTRIDASITFQYANEEAVTKLMAQDESIKELFETEEQLLHFIENEKVVLFEKEGAFIGCGMIIRTHKDWNYCDLGVWVHPAYRKKGIGVQILLRLKSLAEANELIPSCGCAVDNVASQNTIKRSGFISNHEMLCFVIRQK